MIKAILLRRALSMPLSIINTRRSKKCSNLFIMCKNANIKQRKAFQLNTPYEYIRNKSNTQHTSYAYLLVLYI